MVKRKQPKQWTWNYKKKHLGLTTWQVVDCGTEFWMVIHKRPLWFSLLEYGLIIGLNFSSIYPAIPEEDEFRRSHFPGMSIVTMVDLRARIDDLKERLGLRLTWRKLSWLAYTSPPLYWVLGGKRKKEVVDPQCMSLVDDMDIFNTYPWGRLAYEEVLFGFRKDLGAIFEDVTNLAKKRKRDPKFSRFGSLHLSGFVQPLQILAYEVYNGVGEAFANRREDAYVSLPRKCHWGMRK
ncbi:hypothetical protein F511_36327 [Dorcoceras hygrometricum]|uniref:DUF1985 domain-containing protein n=1 Tax=Dorcoceras hygrometricum TaxID=472368 RepID=A0A2Z7BL70_9LAMI|nr:hypothetical protein F511_36327 [Dorcoceras hygrometricum]